MSIFLWRHARLFFKRFGKMKWIEITKPVGNLFYF